MGQTVRLVMGKSGRFLRPQERKMRFQRVASRFGDERLTPGRAFLRSLRAGTRAFGECRDARRSQQQHPEYRQQALRMHQPGNNVFGIHNRLSRLLRAAYPRLTVVSRIFAGQILHIREPAGGRHRSSGSSSPREPATPHARYNPTARPEFSCPESKAETGDHKPRPMA